MYALNESEMDRVSGGLIQRPQRVSGREMSPASVFDPPRGSTGFGDPFWDWGDTVYGDIVYFGDGAGSPGDKPPPPTVELPAIYVPGIGNVSVTATSANGGINWSVEDQFGDNLVGLSQVDDGDYSATFQHTTANGNVTYGVTLTTGGNGPTGGSGPDDGATAMFTVHARW